MIDVLLSDPFVGGAISMVLFLLALVLIVPMFTRHPEKPKQWRVIEPPELLVTAKRIESKEVRIEKVNHSFDSNPARLRHR